MQRGGEAGEEGDWKKEGRREEEQGDLQEAQGAETCEEAALASRPWTFTRDLEDMEEDT